MNLKIKRFVLRNNPIFEIVLNEDSFEINNSDYTIHNGIYHFDEIQSVEFLKSQMDWFPTVLGNLIGLIAGQFGRQKTDDRFVFKFHSGKKMEVKLIKCDIEIVKELFHQLQKRIDF